MPDGTSLGGERIRAAEVIGALCLATDLGTGLPFEHGLYSTLFAIRLGERLGIDAETASQTYYACLLFYAGCTTDAEVSAEIFDDEALATHFNPAMFGSRVEVMVGIMRALAPPGSPPAVRALRVARRLPRAVRGHQRHLVALCEVAQMLTDRLGLQSAVRELFVDLTERWDGKGDPGRLSGDAIPLPLRIAHVARDAALQRILGGEQHAARVVRERAGGAFDPAIANRLADDAEEILALEMEDSAWDETLAREPAPHRTLEGECIDRALAAIGDFADLASPYLVGHSAGVADLAVEAGRRCRFEGADLVVLRRSALVHDVGRVAIPVRIWQKRGSLTPDEWERVRLHAYHSERVLSHSPFLAALAPVGTAHHERLDGSGYHRGAAAAALSPPARVLAAADAYHAMTEPRPHREPLSAVEAGKALDDEARAGRLDADAVTAVLEAAGQRVPRIERPAGLTERETEVVGLLARGLQTKQVAHVLGISVKTADRHVQNAYGKIERETRAKEDVMASSAVAAVSDGMRTERYREAERALWDHYGLEPSERFVELDSPKTRLRLLDVGSGEPLLFVHGTVGPGSWPPLVRELEGFRCLVLDRPGWGLSSPVDFSQDDYATVVADLLANVLDALAIERADVVGGSIGNVWALRLAERHRARVGRVVLLGGSPEVSDVGVPGIIRLLASPLGSVLVRLPDRAERVQSILRQAGHGPSLDAGRIPDVFVDWRVAVGRETDSMRHERDMVRTAVVRGRTYRPGVAFREGELAAITQPTLCVYGTADPVGTVEIWRRTVGLLPRGELRLLEGFGHQPWLDDPARVAAEVARFLAA